MVGRGRADAVVSSAWRYPKHVVDLQENLHAAGFSGNVVYMTPIGAPGADRGAAIATWLAEHAVGSYVIIDDHVDMGELRTNLVLTHPAHGLRPADAPVALAILMRTIR